MTLLPTPEYLIEKNKNDTKIQEVKVGCLRTFEVCMGTDKT
jgi:hypothetical protein